MAKIEKIKKGAATIYPATIPQAVVDPTSGKSARAELDEKANHGYDSSPKTLKEVDEAKVDKTSIVGETGQGETSVMHQKAVTDELGTKASHGYTNSPKTLKQVDDSVSQLAGEVSLLDAVQGAKIKDIENVLSTANLNQSAQLSVSGRKVVSLPKNASNGGMSVKMEGLTAENLVVNGDFRNGTSGWTPVTALRDLLTLQQNGLKITCRLSSVTTDLATYMSVSNFIAEDKYYIAFFIDDYLQVLGGAVFTLRHYASGSNRNIASFPLKKGLTSVVATSAYTSIGGQYITLQGAGSPISPEDFYVIKHSIVLNLTTTFGAGNEPTKEQCDLIFSAYFEGRKNFVPTGRVRSVGKNLFNKNDIIPNKAVAPDGTLSISSLANSNNYIRIQGGLSYYISGRTGQTHIAFYDINYIFISGIIGVNTTFSAPSSAVFVRFSVLYADMNTCKFERGTIATAYDQYRETNLYLTAPELRSNGTVKDEIRKGANGYELVKRVGVGTSNGEIVTGSGFSDPTKWVVSGGTSIISNGTLKLIAEAGIAATSTQSKTITAGKIYRYKIGVLSINGPVYFYIGNTAPRIIQISDIGKTISGFCLPSTSGNHIQLAKELGANVSAELDNISIVEYNATEGVAIVGGAAVYGGNIHYTLATPVITPISYGGILSSAENGTVYHEPVIADAGVYDTKMDILLTDYPISALEEIIVHKDGIDTYLGVSTAVIAADKLSFTHPSLASGDLVLFTYAYNKETTNGNITATFYDSNVVKIDTVTGKAYRINEVVTNGVLTRTLTEV